MRTPHPHDYTVTIEERPDGTWFVRVNELAVHGSGSSLVDALVALGTLAEAVLGGVEELRISAMQAAEGSVEDFLDMRESDAAQAEAGAAVPWEDVKKAYGL